jgi:hypothetical protein
MRKRGNVSKRFSARTGSESYLDPGAEESDLMACSLRRVVRCAGWGPRGVSSEGLIYQRCALRLARDASRLALA